MAEEHVVTRARAVFCASLVLLNACKGPAPAPVPETLRPGSDQTLAMVVPAKGVQIYECRVSKDAGTGAEWVFVAPEAELFNARGNPIGRHGAGPFWQANDGSRVVGTVKQRVDAPIAGAIPWLLLTSKSTSTTGSFSSVSSIQRVNTVGGVAPTAACTSDRVGATERIPYTADYYFFTTDKQESFPTHKGISK